MDTIRRSCWMGSNITSVDSRDSGAYSDKINRLNRAVTEGFKALLTTPCFPRLFDLKVRPYEDEECALLDKGFLRDLAQTYSNLTSLFLVKFGFRVPTPNAFAKLAASLHDLKDAGIGITFGRSEHLMAFIVNLNPSLESLFLDVCGDVRDEAFASVEAHCPNLKTFVIRSHSIETIRLASIIRSKRFLSCIDVSFHDNEDNDSGVIDAIIETKLGLKSFRAHWCPWINDDNLMQLVESQIYAFCGRTLFTTIGIYETKVTLAGLRSVLIRWRSTNPVLPMTIKVLKRVGVNCPSWSRYGKWQPLVDEFPEVSFKSFQSSEDE